MRRVVVVDSNFLDYIAGQARACETVRAAIDAGGLNLLCTHVTVDELAEIPDLERRCWLLVLLIDLARLVPTGAAVADFSRANFCRLDDDEEAFEAFRSGSIAHTRDALIAATAQFERCALVTDDRRLANQARARGIEVLTAADLLSELGLSVPAA